MTAAPVAWVIEFRPRAAEDLRAIIDYIAQDNWKTAVAFGRTLRTRIGQLADNPRQGTLVPPGPLRRLVVHKNYMAYYRLHEDAQRVEIIAIKHAAQRYP